MSTQPHNSGSFLIRCVLAAGCLSASAWAQPPLGYYRQPTLRGDLLVFVAEGDLWKVSVSAAASPQGATATRLTSHPGDETYPRLSPDGASVAFMAQYEGPNEVYVMPTRGGLPTRLTYDGSGGRGEAVIGWTRDQPPRVIAATNRFSTLPSTQLSLIDIETRARELLPLAQAADGDFDDDGTLFFTRLPFQGSQTKRYKGGTAQQIWKFAPTDDEATLLSGDFPGTNAVPMWWQGRVYFLSDRDGTMELWSMRPDGSDKRQESSHGEDAIGTDLGNFLDVRGPDLDAGRIVYQFGADLRLFDINTRTGSPLRITLDSDFDQLREKWVKKPTDYLASARISADGQRVVMTARGQVFVAPRQQGRLAEAARGAGVRYRDAQFMPDGKSLLALSDESGEVELWTLAPDGTEERTQRTTNGDVLRWAAHPSPDGRWVAHHDKNHRLFVLNMETGENTLVEKSDWDGFTEMAWSTDSRWLAFASLADNTNLVIKIYGTHTGTARQVTTDRFVSYSPAWSRDGKFLYFLSDRNLDSVVGSPWGYMAPEPFFDNQTQVYALSLKPEHRWPFTHDDELHEAEKSSNTPPAKEPAEPGQPIPGLHPIEKIDTPSAVDGKDASTPRQAEDKKEEKPKPPAPVEIDFEEIERRLFLVPCAPGNYSALSVTDKRLLFLSRAASPGARASLMVYPIANKDLELKTLVPDVNSYDLSQDGKWVLVRKGDALHVIESGASAPAPLDKTAVNLGGWTFPLDPREEWRQMFREAWRLERDYFYDTGMHGVDWKAMLERYSPLVDRVSTRAELSDLISQMVAELSALHIFVYGGDLRRGETDATPASLGALLIRDDNAGGYRVGTVFSSDPDEPLRTSPLSRPGVNIREGDIITRINGRPTLADGAPETALRNKAGKQVLLRVRPAAGGDERQVIVTPITTGAEADLRYHQWQYTRRSIVDEKSEGKIGYVHLRAMGKDNWTEFAKGFYPAFNRQGLIIDVRHNRGGNIDSWLLSRLMRRAWFYWQPRVGKPFWNMQYAFRGHIVVLCNEYTASDGEAFAEGVKRLGLGTVIGTRTWGGEIWLSSSNFLVDGGIATAAEIGVYGPEGDWLIEGHGVDPDIVVDNLPHATFRGEDAQLDAALAYLRDKIAREPVEVPAAQPHPDLGFPPRR
jgi:tricorn protease